MEEEFNVLVRSEWVKLSASTPDHLGPLKAFLRKLNNLQPFVKHWEKNQKYSMDAEIRALDSDILILENHLLVDALSEKR